MKKVLLRQIPLSWTLYMVECGDGTIYTGITTDLLRRLKAHTNGKGAKYTRGRGPFHLLYTEMYYTKAEALQREARIKQLDPWGKRALSSDVGVCREEKQRERIRGTLEAEEGRRSLKVEPLRPKGTSPV
jgi:putative endonuclease